MPVKPEPSPAVKRISAVITGMIMLCCLVLVVYFMIDTNSPEYKAERTQTAIWEATHPATLRPTRTPRPTQTPGPTRTPTAIPGLNLLTSVAGLHTADAETAFAVIQSVGFTRISEITLQLESEGRTHYLADLGYSQLFIITIVESQIVYIGNDNYVFYDTSQGGVLDNITNHVLPDTDRGTFIYLAQQHVLSALKSPSTAEFPSAVWNAGDWRIGRDHDVITVRSWVDAQNSFGAMIRSIFVAQYSYTSQDLLYLEIDNAAVFGTPAEP